jgi:hypothetical protein
VQEGAANVEITLSSRREKPRGDAVDHNADTGHDHHGLACYRSWRTEALNRFP